MAVAGADETRSRRRDRLTLVLIAAVGLALRLSGLTARGLWLDELVSLQVAARPLAEIARGAVFDNHTPPLYYLLLHAWFRLVPESLATLRLPSVLADVGCLLLLAHVAGRLFGRRLGLAVGAAYAVAPYAVRLSQEGRMYSLLMLLVVATFALSLRVDGGRRWPAVAVALCAAAALYTHYYAALFLLVLHAATAWRLRRDPVARRRWWLALGAAGLAFLPWMPVVLRLVESGGQAFRRFNLEVVPYAALRFAVGFSVLPTTLQGKLHLAAEVRRHLPLLAAVGLLTAAVGLLGVRRALRRAQPGAPAPGEGPVPVGPSLVLLALAPPLLALAVTYTVPSLDERYLAICFPFCLLLAVLGVAEAAALPGRWRAAGRALQAAVVGLVLLAAGCQLARPAAGVNAWRQAAAELRRAAPPPVPIVVSPWYYAPLVQSYVDQPARVGTAIDLHGLHGEAWLVEVVLLSDLSLHLCDLGWRVEERRLLPDGNGLRLSVLRPPPAGRTMSGGVSSALHRPIPQEKRCVSEPPPRPSSP